jgi:hypothetical protein
MQWGSKIDSMDIDVYAHEEGGKQVILKKIRVKKGEYDVSKPFRRHGKGKDCGLILLDAQTTTVSNVTFPQLITAEAAMKMTDTFYLSGYAYEEDNVEYNGTRLWERSIPTNNTDLEEEVVYYHCIPSAVGDSGGPLWFVKGSQLYLLGTHVGGKSENYEEVWGQAFNKNKIETLLGIIRNTEKNN